MTGRLILFVGPTGFDVDPALLDPSTVAVRPPARRGSVDAVVAAEPEPGTIAIADGTFHSYPSVGHAEIRTALRRGWTVWGLSSMGAIRAAEMHTLGMRGYGRVFERYAADPDFTDDEVAMLHVASAPYRPVSEPLIHQRELLADMVKRDALAAADAEKVLHALKHRWYGDRDLPLLRSLLAGVGVPADVIRDELEQFDRHRVKKHDLVSFLKEEKWNGFGLGNRSMPSAS
jgi:hypothetical protein